MTLSDLIIDVDKITEETLESALKGYVGYDPSQRIIILTPEGRKLNQINKVLVFLLAQKGWKFVIKEGEPPQEGLKPKDLGKLLSLGDSIRPVLKKIKDKGLIYLQKDGAYVIPNNMVLEVIDTLKKGNNG
ncbi:hypothetical protein A2165_01275 [Candidatus Curtissbacteria bacterium RBG_13_40_7]|uniref:HTH crp-type domain-containing protein n=1 Tax=Candidatus Curtissbacteria bacterium RBG_13_40_7 TaxID=1797706 RepID=A0A1F5FU83_9BACT|nr:MAG: hypothetical protein A2165_01275 [Candidatus Curtissbacteria bacterium RBG_13_40_7]